MELFNFITGALWGSLHFELKFIERELLVSDAALYIYYYETLSCGQCFEDSNLEHENEGDIDTLTKLFLIGEPESYLLKKRLSERGYDMEQFIYSFEYPEELNNLFVQMNFGKKRIEINYSKNIAVLTE